MARSALLAIVMILACAVSAQASEAHEYRWADFGWRILNLALFCGILWYFVGGLCKRYFKNRRSTIQNTLDELQNRRAEEKAHLEEIEKRIANLEEERQAILAESRAQGERLKKNIMEDARKQASQIVDQARRAAENESRAALDQLRATVADEIVEAARKSLKGRLSEEDHERLIEKSLDKVVLQ